MTIAIPTLRAALQLRDATADDNEALIELAAACTMRGDIALRVDRSPDFFALNRLEGDASRVGVVTDDAGEIVGCVAAARRDAYVNGARSVMGYTSDLKVHPRARRTGAADLLSEYAREACRDLCGPDAPVLLTVLSGNRAMEHRARGPRGTPVLQRLATLNVMAIPLLWRRRERSEDVFVRAASERDIEQMCDLWNRRASDRQFAGVLEPDAFRDWLCLAPGLQVHDYLLAFDAAGHLRGFMGVWDQREFKQMRVLSYSPRLRWVRRAINALSAVTPCPGLPDEGEVLRGLATVHVCAPDAEVLRALLLEAYRQRLGQAVFLTIGLDARDPLLRATDGLLAQPTLVDAYVTCANGYMDPAQFAERPLHYETALV